MNVLLDTNIWIRYIIKDNRQQFEHAEKLFSEIEAGHVIAYGSSIVFLEVNYVLKSLYRFKFEEILEVMEAMRSLRNVTILQDTNIDQALRYFTIHRVKFSDCLIASQMRKDIVLATFDKEMGKFEDITAKPPAEILSSLEKLN